MIVKLLTEHHFEFLSLKGGSTGLYESIHVKSHIVGNHMLRLILCSSSSSEVSDQVRFIPAYSD